MPRFVEVETPYAGDKDHVRRNILYARACVNDCFMRREIPFASHLLYTQPGIMDDNLRSERLKGIAAAREIIEALPDVWTVVYTDLGISPGMEFAIKEAYDHGRNVEKRVLGEDWEIRALLLSRKHSQADVWGF